MSICLVVSRHDFTRHYWKVYLLVVVVVPPCQVSEADSKRDVSDAISLKWKKRRPRKQDEKEEALSKKGNSKRMSLLKRPFSQNIET